MRRTVLMLASMASALLLVCGVALAATIGCDGGLCVGTDNKDTMTGSKHMDTMKGLAGNDSLMARASADTVVGGTGDDVIGGQEGDDRYVFGPRWGSDRITARGEGGGTDTVDLSEARYEDAAATVHAHLSGAFCRPYAAGCREIRAEYLTNSGVVKADVANLADAVRLENFYGGASPDFVMGTAADNRIVGNGNSDEADGYAGDDVLLGGPGSEILDGGENRDVVKGGADSDGLHGGAGKDIIYGGGSSRPFGADDMYGGGGDDTMYGSSGIDHAYGETDNSSTGIEGDDTIDVADRDAGDFVDCGPGTDTVYVDTKVADGRVNDAIDSYVNCERAREGNAPSNR
jgi:Ca2+-binding RTX toxin-like protein